MDNSIQSIGGAHIEAQPFAAPLIPLAVERSSIIAAAQITGKALSEMLNFARHGEYSTVFAFEDEVPTLLAEALRRILEIERARFDRSDVIKPEEVQSVEALQAAIDEFQKIWGREGMALIPEQTEGCVA